MILWTILLCVIPTLATSITISSNGNSPEIKMIGGMMLDVQSGFSPMTPKSIEMPVKENTRKRKLINSTKLSINERYRRLIPYMTFYYANDLVSPTTESYSSKNVEVEKAEIVEAKTIQQQPEPRQSKKLVYNSNHNIPLYQGNRLTQYNIASANPTKYLYKEVIPPPQNTKNSNFNPYLSDHRGINYEYERIVQKPMYKTHSVPFSTRKPYYNLFRDEDSSSVQYYTSEKEYTPKYKLIPYEQTPPVKVLPQNDNVYRVPKLPVSAPISNKEQVYIKPRPLRPEYTYENFHSPQTTSARKPPAVVSETYFENRRPQSVLIQPVIESGFKPIVNPTIHTTLAPIIASEQNEKPIHHFEIQKQHHVVDITPDVPTGFKPNYYQYLVDKPTVKPPQYVQTNTITLADLLNSLQLNKSIPKPITRENVGASIKTLLQVLNALKTSPQQDNAVPVSSTTKPFIEEKIIVTAKPEVVTLAPIVNEPDFHDEPYLSDVKTPSQHIDDFSMGLSTSQRFPQPVNSDDEGGTPGRPGIDYPVLTTIPETEFDCKTQRYKGFFADPATRCQVWHYCDLNGGQASFLCPNGTIFSQAALTCDWWFNVRCASTPQLYVLNESLYKYILPHSPKFPEDYSGPLVDKYLTLKFKEMEEQFKKNKHKQNASEKMDEETTEVIQKNHLARQPKYLISQMSAKPV
ncbi:hypothetical protein ACJJTC_016147 [Scirpophaga incertulas]